MNYLKRSNVPIPEQFRETFPDYGSIGALIDYRRSLGGEVESQIHFCLIPRGNAGRARLCTMGGPTVPSGNDHIIIVEAAKMFLRDRGFLEKILAGQQVAD